MPRVSVVLRKAYGGAYIVMDSRSIGADVALAWPTNEIAVMGAEGAANVVFRREIAAAEDPDAMRRQKIEEYRSELVHPYYAAERGLVDDVIDPARPGCSSAAPWRCSPPSRPPCPPASTATRPSRRTVMTATPAPRRPAPSDPLAAAS